MMRMAAKRKKNKTFYGVHPNNTHAPVYLVYKLVETANNLIADGPFDTLAEANKAMESYLSKGFCSWVVTYNE